MRSAMTKSNSSGCIPNSTKKTPAADMPHSERRRGHVAASRRREEERGKEEFHVSADWRGEGKRSSSLPIGARIERLESMRRCRVHDAAMESPSDALMIRIGPRLHLAPGRLRCRDGQGVMSRRMFEGRAAARSAARRSPRTAAAHRRANSARSAARQKARGRRARPPLRSDGCAG